MGDDRGQLGMLEPYRRGDQLALVDPWDVDDAEDDSAGVRVVVGLESNRREVGLLARSDRRSRLNGYLTVT